MYNLKREKICDSIRKFYSLRGIPCRVSEIQEVGGTRRRVNIEEKDGLTFFIDFHFKKNGTTSIETNNGNENSREIKKQIAEFIIADPECALGDDVTSGSKYYIANDIEYDDFEGIMELLCESDYYNSHTKQTRDYFEQYKFRGVYNESLTIHYYKTKKKILIQGIPLLLFTEAMSLLTELIELDDIPHFFNENYNINLSKNDVEELFDHYFPYSSDKHPVKLKKVLYQAVYNLQIKGDMFTYSYLVFPALKALEGHLKYCLHNYSISLENNKFNMFKFDESRTRYFLKTEHHSKVGDPSRINYFEKAYNFYNRQRHSLFHWADPSLPIDDTRELENIGEARTIILDTFKIIDEYYK
ncbi:type II toxin-antitoxin system RnlA family toxin [Bacillus smithii]|uniref:type II toxin-antitoxin system RnlA family toxin n=1 Tax=Bacillus smithii TaxID=1479 RepID=UPI003D25CA90